MTKTTKEHRNELARHLGSYGGQIVLVAPGCVSPLLPALLADAERCAELEASWLHQHGDDVITADAVQIRDLTDRAEAAEAKLKIAVEALQEIAKKWPGDSAEFTAWVAVNTLAKIREANHE